MSILSPAYADTANKNLPVSAVMNSFCKMNISSINFGVIPIGQSSATTNLDILCSNNSAYTVTMNYPQNGQGNFGGIYASGMLLPIKANNRDWINYNVVLPDGNSWGSKEGVYTGEHGSVAGKKIGILNSTGTASLQSFPVLVNIYTVTYAIPSGYIASDVYSDTMVVTINY